MPDAPRQPDGAGRAKLIQRLAKETGITEAEASDLVMVLGRTGHRWSVKLGLRPLGFAAVVAR
jgi:hypothetical protein